MSRNETIYTPVIKKIQEEMDAVTDHLSSGRPSNFENIKDLSEKSKVCLLQENCCKRLKKDLLRIRGSNLVNSCVYLK